MFWMPNKLLVANREAGLGTLPKGTLADVLAIGPSAISARLMELGIIEGSRIEIVHEAPITGDPIAVRVRGSVVALRRAEANQILVIPVTEKRSPAETPEE